MPSKGIEILAHRRRLPHTDNPDPRTPLAGKFSIQYVTARALADGAVRLRDFEGDAVMEERVRRLLPLITTRPHPDMPDDSPKQFGAEVVVTMKDGRRLSRRIDHLVCRGGDNPMSAEELFEKFEDCAGARAGPRPDRAPVRAPRDARDGRRPRPGDAAAGAARAAEPGRRSASHLPSRRGR